VVYPPKLRVNVPPVGEPVSRTVCTASAAYSTLVTRTVSDRDGTDPGRVHADPPFVPTFTDATIRSPAP